MVNFGSKLATNKRAEWSEHYVDYDKLKKLIKGVAKKMEQIRHNTLLEVSALGNRPHGSDTPGSSAARRTDAGFGKSSGAAGVDTFNDLEEGPEGLFLDKGDDASMDGTANAFLPRIDSRKARHLRSATVSESIPLLTDGSGFLSVSDDSSLFGRGPTSRQSSKTRGPKRKRTSVHTVVNSKGYGSLDGDGAESDSDGPTGSSSKNDEQFVRRVQAQVLALNPDEEFITAVKREAARVESFYQAKIIEYTESLRRLGYEISKLNLRELREDFDAEDDDAVLSKGVLTADNSKRAFRDLYRELKMLQNFSILNYTAFVKIFKKHDKSTGLRTSKRMMELVDKYQQGFVDTPKLLLLMERIEATIARAYHGGNRTMAQSDLLLKHHHVSGWEMTHIGFRLGVVLVLLIWTIWDVVIDVRFVIDEGGGGFSPTQKARVEAQMESSLRVFRGFGFFVLCMWLWSLCVYIWSTDRVNYIYLFEFDPRRAMLWEEVLNKATTTTILYLFLVLGYVKVSLGSMGEDAMWTTRYFPFVIFVYMLSQLIFPLEQTSLFMSSLVGIFTAPLHQVTFFQSFLADVLTSMARPLVDIAFSFCFFFSGEWHHVFDEKGSQNRPGCAENPTFALIAAPLIVSLPLLIRLLQNLRRYYDTKRRYPHLVNAVKYFSAQQLVVLGALHPQLSDMSSTTGAIYKTLFITALVISTLFTYYWDIRMDWGIRQFRFPLRGIDLSLPTPVPRVMLLREKRLYTMAIFVDLILRFSWCLTLVPNAVLKHYIDANNQVFLLGSVEILRRTMWAIIRVEYEHAYNEHEYRRVGVVPSLFEQDENVDRKSRDTSRKSVIAEVALFSVLTVFFCFLSFLSTPKY